MTIHDDIIAYLRFEREPIEPTLAARVMARMARLAALHSGDAMSRCTPETEYIDAMLAMVRSGELIEKDSKVWVPVAKKKPQATQRELF